MKSKSTILAVLGTLLACSRIALAQGNIAVTVNGEPVNFSGQPPVQQNGRLLVPLRGVLEKIGATVRYSGPTKTIQAAKGDTNIQLVLGEASAVVNGKSVTLDVPAQARNGTTLVPLRFVAESLGADVRFDGTAQVVAIRTDGKPNNIEPPKATDGTIKPTKEVKDEVFAGVFVDFEKTNDDSYTLKMTDGRTVTLAKDAELLYQGQKIGFDDLRSGDKVVTIINKNGRGTHAVISDDEG